jgi:hypothetical protein
MLSRPFQFFGHTGAASYAEEAGGIAENCGCSVVYLC